jgi:hypothetical protein
MAPAAILRTRPPPPRQPGWPAAVAERGELPLPLPADDSGDDWWVRRPEHRPVALTTAALHPGKFRITLRTATPDAGGGNLQATWALAAADDGS